LGTIREPEVQPEPGTDFGAFRRFPAGHFASNEPLDGFDNSELILELYLLCETLQRRNRHCNLRLHNINNICRFF